MRLAARMIATMTVAFVMVPALHADDTATSKAKSKEDDSAKSSVASAAAPDAPPVAATSPLLSSPFRLEPPPPTGQPPIGMSQMGDSDVYVPKGEVFVGYTFWRNMPAYYDNRVDWLHGASMNAAYNFDSHLGLVVDIAGFPDTSIRLAAPGTPTQTYDSSG